MVVGAVLPTATLTGCGDDELVCDYDLAAGRCRHPGARYGHAPAPPEGDTGARLTISPTELVFADIPIEGIATGDLLLVSSGSGPLTIERLDLSVGPVTDAPWNWSMTVNGVAPPAVFDPAVLLQPGQELPVRVTVHRPDSKVELLGEIQLADLSVRSDAYTFEGGVTPTARVEARAR